MLRMNNQQGKRIQKRPDDIGASSSGSSERGPGRGRGRGKSSGGGSARSSDTSTRPQRQDARQVQPQLYQNPNPASSSTAQPQQHYQSGHAQPDHSPHVPTIVRPVILGAKQASDVSLGTTDSFLTFVCSVLGFIGPVLCTFASFTFYDVFL